MKTYKRIDFYGSLLLLVFFTIMILWKREPGSLITAYFTVGGWQVISMLVHAGNHWFTPKGGTRRGYHWITLIAVLTMPLGSFLILYFIAPVMACFYTWLCYDESYTKMKRPLSILK